MSIHVTEFKIQFVKHFDHGGLRQLQNNFVTDIDLHGQTFLQIELHVHYRQFISHAIAMSLYHIKTL